MIRVVVAAAAAIGRLLIFEHLHQILYLYCVRGGASRVVRLLLLRGWTQKSSATVAAFSRLIVAARLALGALLLQL